MIRERVTAKKLRGWIIEGRGVGHGTRYTPWITISKRNTSSKSLQAIAHMPGVRRLCHYLSRAELNLAHLLWWLGAVDVREQYPLWPWSHSHPLAGLNPDIAYLPHPGMGAIADAAGIKLFRYPGLKIPAVLTIDIVATFLTEAGARLIAFSCKPEGIVRAANPSDRVLERLELDRLYWIEVDVTHRLVHAEQLPNLLIAQLQWLAPVDHNIDTLSLTSSSEYLTFVERFSKSAFSMPANEAAREASIGLNWNDYLASYAMRLSMWRLDVDVNPLKRIDLTSPLNRGGCKLRDYFRSKLL